MKYAAVLSKEGGATLAEFPDAPGCRTFAEPGESIYDVAHEALTGWLGANLLGNTVPPPRPKQRAPKGRVLWVDVPARLAVKLGLRWARANAGLTQAQLAKRAGVSQQAIAKLEHPDANPTIETIEKVAHALGATVDIEIRSQVAA
jgi:DNA-binding XRE family transcriptional regulator/predicted RNase H-like HicB family nuclease